MGNSLSADHGHRSGQRGSGKVLPSGLWEPWEDLSSEGCSAREGSGLRGQGPASRGCRGGEGRTGFLWVLPVPTQDQQPEPSSPEKPGPPGLSHLTW